MQIDELLPVFRYELPFPEHGPALPELSADPLPAFSQAMETSCIKKVITIYSCIEELFIDILQATF